MYYLVSQTGAHLDSSCSLQQPRSVHAQGHNKTESLQTNMQGNISRSEHQAPGIRVGLCSTVGRSQYIVETQIGNVYRMALYEIRIGGEKQQVARARELLLEVSTHHHIHLERVPQIRHGASALAGSKPRTRLLGSSDNGFRCKTIVDL